MPRRSSNQKPETMPEESVEDIVNEEATSPSQPPEMRWKVVLSLSRQEQLKDVAESLGFSLENGNTLVFPLAQKSVASSLYKLATQHSYSPGG